MPKELHGYEGHAGCFQPTEVDASEARWGDVQSALHTSGHRDAHILRLRQAIRRAAKIIGD